MRLSSIAFALGAMVSGALTATTVQADGLECQANIIYGNNTTVTDVATGTSVIIVPEAYLPTTGVYGSYDFDLGTGTSSYSPIPASSTTYQSAPVPPIPYAPAPAATPSTFLDGTMWQLVSLDNRPVTANATLNFEAGGRYGGRAACNAYGGSVTAFTNFKINFQGPIATRVACAQLSEEQLYFSILEAATDFRPGREGDTLALLDSAGVTRATFQRQGATPGQPPATGSASVVGAWTVAGVLVDGAFSTDSGFGTPDLEFTADGRFFGNLGCNNAQGTYTQTGSSISFGQVAVTARQCIVPAPFEGPVLAALPLATTVQTTTGGISLLDASGVELIRLAR